MEKFDIPIHKQGMIEHLEKKSDIEDIYALANIYSPLFVQKEANMLVYHQTSISAGMGMKRKVRVGYQIKFEYGLDQEQVHVKR